jgi:protein-tyrosine phosphatase
MSEVFPFDLNDIKSWTIRRKDGIVTRYTIVAKDATVSSKAPTIKYAPKWSGGGGFSAWCNHTPDTANPPIFSDGKVNLYIADCTGARKTSHMFDVCIDGGGVLTVPGEYDLPTLYGDPGLVKTLNPHAYRSAEKVDEKKEKILKIRWADRCPPPVAPSFWPALNDYLHELAVKKGEPLNVLTICQGGHGRSGSALTLLMMCMTDYSALDALTHLRALHCARAIESKDQHIYLNAVAAYLKRPQNALEAEQVKSFKDRFLTLTGPVPDAYRERVKSGKGSLVHEREAGYL